MDIYTYMKTRLDCEKIKFHNLPQVLVVSHGGVRGFYELGYLHVLDKEGVLKEVDTYVGVSVGAIISLLLACGYKPSEIVNIAIISDMLSMACISGLSQTWNNKGLLSTEKIENTLKKYVQKKFLHIPSFRTLFNITGKTLCTVGVDLSSSEAKYFDPISTPDVSCVEGVMLSIIIPFMLYERKFENNSYIDGAIGNPYPIDQYDDGETSILGISISTNYGKIDDDTDVMYQFFNRFIHLLQIFDAFIECHKTTIISKCSSKVINMVINDNSLDFIGLTKGNNEKARMLYVGSNLAEEDIKWIKWISNGKKINLEPRRRIIHNRRENLCKSL